MKWFWCFFILNLFVFCFSYGRDAKACLMLGYNNPIEEKFIDNCLRIPSWWSLNMSNISTFKKFVDNPKNQDTSALASYTY